MISVYCYIKKQYMYNSLVKLLNLELEKQNWLRSNKLSLNVQKTYYIIMFHTSRIKIDDHSVITMSNACLQRTNSLNTYV